MKYYIGIDLGGMSAKGAIFGEDGALIVKKSVATQPEDGFEGTVDKMAGLCKELAAEAKTSMKNVEAIGMAVPGVYRRGDRRCGPLGEFRLGESSARRKNERKNGRGDD